MSTQDRPTTETRSDRLARLFDRVPEAVACRRCGSPVRPHRRDRRVWEHVTTGLVRCTGTRGVTHATPVGSQMALTSLDGKEVA
ncbi:hypothetical protein [Saccharopolyspora rosea]|uniref:hypothetical protein n=1 Tax=Saccharopolyspora rosea TaxID=524884 RepID=UPI0021D8E1C8|nr:hypothetical protein [Saccharopolyspora rosea]